MFHVERRVPPCTNPRVSTDHRRTVTRWGRTKARAVAHETPTESRRRAHTPPRRCRGRGRHGGRVLHVRASPSGRPPAALRARWSRRPDALPRAAPAATPPCPPLHLPTNAPPLRRVHRSARAPAPADDRVEPSRDRRAPVTGRRAFISGRVVSTTAVAAAGRGRPGGATGVHQRAAARDMVSARGDPALPAWAVQRALLTVARSPASGPVASRRDRAHIVCRGETTGATIWRGMGRGAPSAMAAGRGGSEAPRFAWRSGGAGWGALGGDRVGGDGAAVTVMRADAVPVS